MKTTHIIPPRTDAPTPEVVAGSTASPAAPAAPVPAVPAAPAPAASAIPEEIGGPTGPEPTRYGDWEQKGRCSDF